MFIVREDPTLLDFHLKELHEEGRCFSNARRGPGEPQGVNRLTGLHFMYKDWFAVTDEARDKYYNLLVQGGIGNESIDDELMLAKIVTESGMELSPQKNLIERHHGVHMGTLRNTVHESIQERNRAFRARINHHRADRWQGIVNTQEYRSIFNKIQNYDRLSAWELKEADRITKQMVKERVSR